MRSRKDYTLCGSEVHQWALSRLLEAKLAKDHGWLCTAVMVLNLVLRAARARIPFMRLAAICPKRPGAKRC